MGKLQEKKSHVKIPSNILYEDDTRDNVLLWIKKEKPNKDELINYLLKNQERFRLPYHQNSFSYPSYLDVSCGMIRLNQDEQYYVTDSGKYWIQE